MRRSTFCEVCPGIYRVDLRLGERNCKASVASFVGSFTGDGDHMRNVEDARSQQKLGDRMLCWNSTGLLFRHSGPRPQWEVFMALGGPLAYPFTAY